MATNIPIKTAGDKKLAHTDIAIRIKRMLNDIIDVAYQKEVSPDLLHKFKRFTIYATETERSSFLGDCWHNKDGSSSIRLLRLGRDRYQESLIVAIHEVSHHVEYAWYGKSGHSTRFYQIHKKLLFAAFDMGVLRVEDITIDSESHAANKHKLAAMMKEYTPNPVPYKQNTINIFIYNCFEIKEQLKAHGYHWNGLDKAWTKEVQEGPEQQEEYAFLRSLSVPVANVKEVKGGAVVTRLRKSIKLFRVQEAHVETIKRMGYRWVDAGKEKYWRKMLAGDALPDQEREALSKIPGVIIKID